MLQAAMRAQNKSKQSTSSKPHHQKPKSSYAPKSTKTHQSYSPEFESYYLQAESEKIKIRKLKEQMQEEESKYTEEELKER